MKYRRGGRFVYGRQVDTPGPAFFKRPHMKGVQRLIAGKTKILATSYRNQYRRWSINGSTARTYVYDDNLGLLDARTRDRVVRGARDRGIVLALPPVLSENIEYATNFINEVRRCDPQLSGWIHGYITGEAVTTTTH